MSWQSPKPAVSIADPVPRSLQASTRPSCSRDLKHCPCLPSVPCGPLVRRHSQARQAPFHCSRHDNGSGAELCSQPELCRPPGRRPAAPRGSPRVRGGTLPILGSNRAFAAAARRSQNVGGSALPRLGLNRAFDTRRSAAAATAAPDLPSAEASGASPTRPACTCRRGRRVGCTPADRPPRRGKLWCGRCLNGGAAQSVDAQCQCAPAPAPTGGRGLLRSA